MIGRIKGIFRSNSALAERVQYPLIATTADAIIYTNSGQSAVRVRSIVVRIEVAGTHGSAVTAAFKKCKSGTNIAGGTALHTGTANLKGTAATNQTLTLSTANGGADVVLAPGDSIAIDVTGTLTSVVANASIDLVPA